MEAASIFDQILGQVTHLEGIQAYGMIFGILLACGLGLPIPEDITLVTAGYLAYLENIELKFAIAVGFFGVLAGDFILFSLGRLLGKRVFKLPGIRLVVTPKAVAIAEEKLRRNARKVCFTARFLAGLRAPIYLSAGILGVRPLIFIAMDSLAALLSVPALVYLGYHFGDEIELGLNYMRRAEKYILVVLAILGAVVVFKAIRKRVVAADT